MLPRQKWSLMPSVTPWKEVLARLHRSRQSQILALINGLPRGGRYLSVPGVEIILPDVVAGRAEQNVVATFERNSRKTIKGVRPWSCG